MNKERKNIRLADWDYSSEGIYFITICCRDRQSFFGKINNYEMILSEIGLIASQYWLEIPDHFPHVKLEEFVVMPNHVHGILILDYSLVETRHCMILPEGNSNCHENASRGDNTSFDGMITTHDQTRQPIERDSMRSSSQSNNQFSRPIKNSVSVIINQYKSSVKRWCNKNGSNHFQWQSRFYDQILHNENSIDKTREYICTNPKHWIEDELYN